MKILIVSATEFELARIKDFCTSNRLDNVDFCVTGVGMVATSFSLTKALSEKKYDLLINVGICGSFKRSIKLLQVLEISSEVFSDSGIESVKGFIPLAETDLLDENKHPYKCGLLINDSPQFADLQKVKGSTSDNCHTSLDSISRIVELFAPDTESMEGGAFFYVAKHFDIPFAQVRAVSNYVGERGEGKWKIKEAIEAVNGCIIDYLKQVVHAKI